MKLCWETGTGGVGNPRPNRIVSRFKRTWAMVNWSELLARTSNRFNNSSLQCWCTKGRLWSIPNKAMCSINGMWIDQSMSSESDGKSLSNITAMLHLKKKYNLFKYDMFKDWNNSRSFLRTVLSPQLTKIYNNHVGIIIIIVVIQTNREIIEYFIIIEKS